jgi:hypothetical protein
MSTTSAVGAAAHIGLVAAAADRGAALSTEDETAVIEAVGALEIAEGPVPADLPALADPGLRGLVAARLAACGRVLLSRPDGYCSGYDDGVADELVERGIGTLSETERAVLGLVLLRSVAVPRARGRLGGEDWVQADATPVTVEELAQNRHLSRSAIDKAVRRLRTLGLLRPGHRADIVPGPALQRLSPQRSAGLWEDLLLLAAPTSSYARHIRARRETAGRATGRSGPRPSPSTASRTSPTPTTSQEPS